MSTIKTNTLTGTTSAGSIVVTGEGGSTTTNLQQGLAKLFVHFDGDTTDAGTDLDGVNDSFNLGSIVDNAVGDYSLNPTNNMGSDNIAISGHAPSADTLTSRQWAFVTSRQKSEITASSVRVTTAYTYNANQADFDGTSVILHGDLA
tara:strand:+ start:135 stop:575 length:441 start_codon:yes stop_codon:yes gene_type:complete